VIVDTSALIAIFYGEPEGPEFTRLIHDAPVCRISVASLIELSMVIEGQLGPDAARQADAYLRRAGVAVEPITIEQGQLARQAFLDFGKGRHPAGLNFGDLFSYALSKATGEPLLFKGADFRRTDVTAAR
jgi:ribonuclease VapC